MESDARPNPSSLISEEAETEVIEVLTRPSPVRRVLRFVGVFFVLTASFLAFAVLPPAKAWWEAGIIMVNRHARFEVTHPGWSFPARVVTRPVGPKEPFVARLSAAQMLGYAEKCPTPGPGEYCEKTKKVVPRSGDSIEPIELGRLVGADGEIREHLPFEQAPKHLIDALVAAEDRSFYQHRGVDLTGLIRATVANLRGGRYAQGGSTLTMQLVRNLSQDKQRTVSRKIREIIVALAADRHLGKEGVLSLYLDTPYLGQLGGMSICGFRAAAKHYFGKDVTDIDIAEAATLVAILPAPGRLAPDRDPKLTKEKRDRVLKAMEPMGYDVRAELAKPIRTVPPVEPTFRFPAYLSAVRASLEETLEPSVLYGAGLTIVAGVDPWLQDHSERLFPEKTKYLQELVGAHTDEPLEAAAVLLDLNDGRVRAIYGGQGVGWTDFNRATQARRQAGSAFKPVVYALGFSQRDADGKPKFTAATAMPNAPRTFKTPAGDFRPRNVGGEYSETACLAQALAWSQNIATASLLEAAGGPKVLIPFAERLGFVTKHYPAEMGLALGQGEVTPLELAEFAATIARSGLKVRGRVVLSAKDPLEVERWPQPSEPVRVLDAESATLVRELMRLVVDGGTGGTIRGVGEPGVQGPVMGKTGTTDLERDLWFIGATPKYAAVVWLGYDKPEPIGGSASDLAAPLWGWWLHKLSIVEPTTQSSFMTEPKLTRRWICTVTGRIAGPHCQGINAPFISGTEPKTVCTHEHPAPPPKEEDPTKPKWEGLWKRIARQKEEAVP